MRLLPPVVLGGMALGQQQAATLAGHALDFPPALFPLPALEALLFRFGRGHTPRRQRGGVARPGTIPAQGQLFARPACRR